MGQQQSHPKESFIYTDSHNIGYIESLMNTLIFIPPKKELFTNNQVKPFWLKYITLPNSNKLSYFIIDPIDNNTRSTKNKSDGNKIKSNKKYILWSHGNSGDLTSIYSLIKSFHEIVKGKIGFIVYDYEGYGYSDGICSEKNCYNDLTCMIKYSLTVLGIRKRNLFLIGQSLGTGIVVDFCFRHYWKTPIILISPYKSISRVKIDPFWIDITSNIVIDSVDMFTTHHKLEYLKCPIVIYHGVYDEIISASHSIEMYNNHKHKIKLLLVENASHNNILNHVGILELFRTIEEFSKYNRM